MQLVTVCRPTVSTALIVIRTGSETVQTSSSSFSLLPLITSPCVVHTPLNGRVSFSRNLRLKAAWWLIRFQSHETSEPLCRSFHFYLPHLFFSDIFQSRRPGIIADLSVCIISPLHSMRQIIRTVTARASERKMSGAENVAGNALSIHLLWRVQNLGCRWKRTEYMVSSHFA